MRRLALPIVALALATSSFLWLPSAPRDRGGEAEAQAPIRRKVTERLVNCTTALSHLIAFMPTRQNLWLINVDAVHVYVGGDGTDVRRAFVLHSAALGPAETSRLNLPGYTGGLTCLTATGGAKVLILEDHD